MALQRALTAGQLEFAVNTAVGTMSCAVNPVAVGGQILKAAQSLQDAAEAAAISEEICRDIMLTAIARVPVVCKLLRLGQLFPDDGDAADLDAAMRQCCGFAFDALHEAVTAMYRYLECNKLNRLRQAASIEKLMGEKRWQLINRFNDANAYMTLANLLSNRQSTQQAQRTTSVVQDLQQKVLELKQVHAADKARVKALAQAMLARQTVEGQKIKVSKKQVWALAASPSGDCVVTASEDPEHSAAVWDTATGSRMHELRGHSAGVTSVAWSPDGARVATGSADSTAALWDAVTGSRTHELRGHGAVVSSVAWSPDGARVATASWDQTVAVWDVATGGRICELRGHSDWVNTVVWSPDGARVATASRDHTAAVWDVATGGRMHELRGHSEFVSSVAWSPDGSRVVTASWDSTAAVWDTGTGSRMHELRGHGSGIRSVAWSPNGSRVATGSADSTAAVWDPDTGGRMHELRGHKSSVSSVAWSPDGCCVYSSSKDGIVRIHSVAARR